MGNIFNTVIVPVFFFCAKIYVRFCSCTRCADAVRSQGQRILEAQSPALVKLSVEFLRRPKPLSPAHSRELSFLAKEILLKSISLYFLSNDATPPPFFHLPSHVRAVLPLKRWAYVADALEELCPGATDRNHWPPSTNTPANAPPPKLALAASGSGSGAASAASAAAADTTAAATATVAAAAVTAALSSEPESAERPPSLEGTASVVGRRVVAGAAADAPSDAHPAAKALSDPAASPSASAAAASAETAMPMATVHAVAVPNPRPARPNHVLPRPSLPVSTENVMAVAKELWDYVRESTPAGARARGEGVGGRYSPSLPWSAPPVFLLDALLEDVSRALGDP